MRGTDVSAVMAGEALKATRCAAHRHSGRLEIDESWIFDPLVLDMIFFDIFFWLEFQPVSQLSFCFPGVWPFFLSKCSPQAATQVMKPHETSTKEIDALQHQLSSMQVFCLEALRLRKTLKRCNKESNIFREKNSTKNLILQINN